MVHQRVGTEPVDFVYLLVGIPQNILQEPDLRKMLRQISGGDEPHNKKREGNEKDAYNKECYELFPFDLLNRFDEAFSL